MNPAPPPGDPAPELPAFPGSAAAAPPPPYPGDAPEPPPRPRRRTLRTVGIVAASVLVVALVVGGFYGWTVVADQRQAAAAAELADHERSAAEAHAAVAARARSSESEAARIRAVVDSAPFAADTDPTVEPVRAALGELDVALAASAEATAIPAPARETPALDADPAFALPWELMSTAETLEAGARRLDTAETALRATADSTADAEAALTAAESAYFASLATRSQAEIDASPLASRKSQVDLGYLLDTAADDSLASYRDAAFLTSVQTALQALRDSQALETAELADPALDTRREIEAYARSLSAGVVLDFVWAEEVNGLGENWLSGTAETYDSDGGWSIISLNYTVEDAWNEGDENARALVAHEVGHTQVIRDVCEPLFAGPVFGSDQETWATAYSISLGFDLPGSGIEAYGRPTDDQIATAAACR